MNISDSRSSYLYIQIPALVSLLAFIITVIESVKNPNLIDLTNLYLIFCLLICMCCLIIPNKLHLISLCFEKNRFFLMNFFGFFLVFFSKLTTFSLNTDEATMALLYQKCLPQTAGLLQNNPPLSGTFSLFNFFPFPPSEFSLRMFPSIFMATSCALIANFFYGMGIPGFISIAIALLFASNRYTIFYSRRARSISLGIMLLLCLLFVIERFISDKKFSEFRFPFVGILLLALLSLGLQPVGVGVAVGIFALFFLKDRKQLASTVGLLVISAVLFLPFQLQLLESLPKGSSNFQLSHFLRIFDSFHNGFYLKVLIRYLQVPFLLIAFFSFVLFVFGKMKKQELEIYSWLKMPFSILQICIIIVFLFLIIPAFDALSNGAIALHYVYFLLPSSVLLLGFCLGNFFRQKPWVGLKSLQVGTLALAIGFFSYQ